ncbi:hypothetical protein GCM10018793_29000 [Streptomyces sulfonofaciens]|uniref:PE-PGRS family protein n=1 Tax=Streptomyces sulfonofaciens TaxID=68272 RepID=A0A919G6R3_9ACTN|nr:hypothetical protein [Streptomyces sulfonofaciens]GHH78466.1 hypothetical protein GCM10018793_29000 [Streptomyces sulfonofaciens]
MADRPQPEWRQDADRHSLLIDPVLTVRQLSPFGFSRTAHSRIDHALVFATAGGAYKPYLPPVRPTRRETAAKRFVAVYEVDMGVHRVRARLKLPSCNDALEFEAEVELTWQVDRPEEFVRCGQRNVPDLLLHELQRAARPVSRDFPIEQSAEAEAELSLALEKNGSLGAEAGLRSQCTLRLSRDQGSVEHERRLLAIDQLSLEEKRKAGHEVELQQWERQKIDFYRHYLEQRGVAPWALQVMKQPEDLAGVMDKMQAHQMHHLQKQLDLVNGLLSQGKVENHELEAPLRHALTFIQSVLGSGLTDLPPHGPEDDPLPLPGSRAPHGFHPGGKTP